MRKQPIAVERRKRKKKTHHEYSPLFHYQLPVQTAADWDEWESPRSQREPVDFTAAISNHR